ncbi:protein SLOW GREEN 1, chloroplastic [Stylosanthes scabra]|uniref:Protein SLOW GREEN 1, chloroplastic n=1 Tax=Stylosanthes scabra TaxID=79078 RepID=A0ABU6QHC0_9FABA|nr:protein SLOW GREEN 1, chloroplastic [Stylosanthes scabra]
MSTSTFTTPTATPSFFSFPRPHSLPPPNLPFHIPLPIRRSFPRFTLSAHSSPSTSTTATNPILRNLKTLAGAAVFAAAIAVKFSALPARAELPPATVTAAEQSSQSLEESTTENAAAEAAATTTTTASSSSPLSEFLGTNDEAVNALKSLLQQKLEVGEDEEALSILKRLCAAQPEVTDWKFLTARLMSETGEIENARKVYEEILASNPLSFEALFENALLMDRSGEGEAVMKRLEEALAVAKEKNKAKEARDVRLIMAQIQFLQKNVDEALGIYQELTKEDPCDFRPYFCRGMIYSLLDRNDEAKEQFAKYRELSPKKFEVDGYLRTPLSRMKLFGSDES